jgi:hypothetical protein
MLFGKMVMIFSDLLVGLLIVQILALLRSRGVQAEEITINE